MSIHSPHHHTGLTLSASSSIIHCVYFRILLGWSDRLYTWYITTGRLWADPGSTQTHPLKFAIYHTLYVLCLEIPSKYVFCFPPKHAAERFAYNDMFCSFFVWSTSERPWLDFVSTYIFCPSSKHPVEIFAYYYTFCSLNTWSCDHKKPYDHKITWLMITGGRPKWGWESIPSCVS